MVLEKYKKNEDGQGFAVWDGHVRPLLSSDFSTRLRRIICGNIYFNNVWKILSNAHALNLQRIKYVSNRSFFWLELINCITDFQHSELVLYVYPSFFCNQSCWADVFIWLLSVCITFFVQTLAWPICRFHGVTPIPIPLFFFFIGLVLWKLGSRIDEIMIVSKLMF